MEIYSSIEAFGFARDLICSTRRRNIFNKLAVIVLQHIMTPSLISLEVFALFVTYLFVVWLVHNNYDFLG